MIEGACEEYESLKNTLNCAAGVGVYTDLCIKANPINIADKCKCIPETEEKNENFSYGEFACPYGYFFDESNTDEKICSKISNQYCAEFDGSDCTKCL